MTDWVAVAGEVADVLARDVVERDRAGAPPFAEAELLRSSGLLGLWIPTRGGGAGADLATTLRVLRAIARVDGSIAHLLGYHFNFVVGSLGDAEPEVAERVWRQTLERRWLWASTGSPADVPLRLDPDDSDGSGADGWWLSGGKTFATGSRVADRILGYVTDPVTQHDLAVVLDPTRDELRRRDDWDTLGQRLSASNGLDLDRYRVSRDDVVIDYGPRGAPRPPHQTLGPLFSQLLFSHLCQAMAAGVLDQGIGYVRRSSRAWFHAEVETARQDPYVLEQVGTMISRLEASAALNDKATDVLQQAYDRGPALTDGERAHVSQVIAASRVVANRTGLEVSAQVFDVVGARATARSYGFDLAWRNIRTLTLHDPTVYKAREIGEFVINGTLPTPSPYR